MNNEKLVNELKRDCVYVPSLRSLGTRSLLPTSYPKGKERETGQKKKKKKKEIKFRNSGNGTYLPNFRAVFLGMHDRNTGYFNPLISKWSASN